MTEYNDAKAAVDAAIARYLAAALNLTAGVAPGPVIEMARINLTRRIDALADEAHAEAADIDSIIHRIIEGA